MTEQANNRASRHMTHLASNPARVGVPVLAAHTLRHALPAGSRVLTAKGESLVETLEPGRRIITRDSGMTTIRDVIRMDVARGTPMIRIPANAMGHGKPERDILLPPDQPVVLRDWRAKTIFRAKEARVAAQRLIDGSIIRPDASDGGAVWCVVLDRPSAIYVDGLELVSGALDPVQP